MTSLSLLQIDFTRTLWEDDDLLERRDATSALQLIGEAMRWSASLGADASPS